MTQGNPQIDTIRRLGEVSRTYEAAAVAFRDVVQQAARSEAEYRRLKAIAVTRAIAEGASVAKAEYVADADPEVARACMDYKMAGAVADSARSRLAQLRSQMDYGRSVLTSEREADRLHSMGGAA